MQTETTHTVNHTPTHTHTSPYTHQPNSRAGHKSDADVVMQFPEAERRRRGGGEEGEGAGGERRRGRGTGGEKMRGVEDEEGRENWHNVSQLNH